MTPIVRCLAEYACGVRFEELPAEVVALARRHLVDTVACALGGASSEPARIARAWVHDQGARGQAEILGAGTTTAPDLAAFINGTMIRYLDFNDTYLSREACHPSDNLAAVLAVAQQEGRSGRDLLLAMVLSYELLGRLADGASIRARGWDHVTYGAFSAAAAAARLAGLTVEQTEQALNLAGTPNNALRQTRAGEMSMWKACAFANACRNAVVAVGLARWGMTGPTPLFEGAKGFWRQVSGEFALAPFGGGGRPFTIQETSIKPMPAEYHAQAAIEAGPEGALGDRGAGRRARPPGPLRRGRVIRDYGSAEERRQRTRNARGRSAVRHVGRERPLARCVAGHPRGFPLPDGPASGEGDGMLECGPGGGGSGTLEPTGWSTHGRPGFPGLRGWPAGRTSPL